MKKTVKFNVLMICFVISLVVMLIGSIFMFAAAVEKYGWMALLANGKTIRSLFAIGSMWSMPLYRVGLIIDIIGTALGITFGVIIQMQ